MSITLSPLEARLLERLILAKNRPVNHVTLTDHVWQGFPPKSLKAVYILVHTLRRKLPTAITTHKGRGWAITPGWRRPSYTIAGRGCHPKTGTALSRAASTSTTTPAPLPNLTALEAAILEVLKRRRGKALDAYTLAGHVQRSVAETDRAARSLAQKVPAVSPAWGRGWGLATAKPLDRPPAQG